jgi:hypothetical protein
VTTQLPLSFGSSGFFGAPAIRIPKRAPGESERSYEIGVRMALGADARAVLWMVLKRGLRLAVMGVLIGLPGPGPPRGCSAASTTIWPRRIR